MTFDEVLAEAGESPRIARLATSVEAARAALVTARTYRHNPEVELEAADRRSDGRSTTDSGVGVTQRFELAGQRHRRSEVATAALDAAQATFRQGRAEVLGTVARAFADAVHRRELLAVEAAEAELARSFAALVARRLDAGSATAVDFALAQAGLARAERGLALAEGSYRTAQARLAEVVGRSDVSLVIPTGDLPQLESPPALEAVLARAVSVRGDVAAANARVDAAQARRRLERADRFPDLAVGARIGREEGDGVTGISLAVPIPIFQRNQGAIAEAEAELTAVRSELALAELAARREVVEAHGQLEAALVAKRATERLGVTPLEDGLALLRRAFESGKIGSAELLVYRRELVEGRRQAVAASRDAWQAALDLAVATGGVLPGWEWMNEEEAR